jgi:hypothetical protein
MLSFAAMLGILLLGVVPEGGVLRNPETGEILNSPVPERYRGHHFHRFPCPGIRFRHG